MPILRQPVRSFSRPRGSEDGYILVAVLFLVALVLIGLAVAAPRMAKSIQRDKEIELVHRGEQYRRAIKLYYKKFGAYPTSIDQLLDTNNIRFLRKRYTDPITGKDDWRLIHLGQAKVPPMGFFGQPLAGIPGAANIGSPVSAATGKTAGGTSAFGQSSFGSTSMTPTSPFGGTAQDVPQGDSEDSGTDTGVTGGSAASNPPGTNTGANPAPGAQSPGATSASNPTSPMNPSAAGTSGTSAFGSNATKGSNGFGAGPIVGVGIPSTKASLLDYKKQTHYNKWEFVYNPIEDQMEQAAGMLGAGQGASGSGTNSSSPFGSGSSNSSSPFSSGPSNSSSPFGGSSSSLGGATTTPPPNSSPQQ